MCNGIKTSPLIVDTTLGNTQISDCLLSLGRGITVTTNWVTLDDRELKYQLFQDGDIKYNSDTLFAELNGPQYEVDGMGWNGQVTVNGGGGRYLTEFPYMAMFSDFGLSAGESYLIVVKFPLPGVYRYVIRNKLSKYQPGVVGRFDSGFMPSLRRISDARVELNINGYVITFFPPYGEVSKDIDGSIYLPPALLQKLVLKSLT